MRREYLGTTIHTNRNKDTVDSTIVGITEEHLIDDHLFGKLMAVLRDTLLSTFDSKQDESTAVPGAPDISTFKDFHPFGKTHRVPKVGRKESWSTVIKDEASMRSEYCSIRAIGRKLNQVYQTRKENGRLIYTRIK